MKTKTILLIIIIVLAIYFGYKMRKENMTKEQEDALKCKWTDNNGVVRNPTEKECYECYECQNNTSGNKISRLRGKCITTSANANDIETQGNFIKYSDSRICETF
jgi:hypothetical protein